MKYVSLFLCAALIANVNCSNDEAVSVEPEIVQDQFIIVGEVHCAVCGAKATTLESYDRNLYAYCDKHSPMLIRRSNKESKHRQFND